MKKSEAQNGFPLGGSCQRPRPLTDEGEPCGNNPFTGNHRKLAPHPASVGASATFPRRGRPDKQKRQDAETSCHRNITLRFLFRRNLIGFALAVQRFLQRVPGKHRALDAGGDMGNALQGGHIL